MTHQQIHSRALEIADRYRKCVCELIDILQLLDTRKTFREYECTSLYQYALIHLRLSENVALNYIAVARKAVEVPALKQEIKSGALTVSHARKMCSVITPANQAHWLGLGKSVTAKVLEREVAKVNPKASVTESTTYVSGDRIAFRLGVSEKFMQKLKRVQDLESQRTKRAVDKEDALRAAVDGYLEKNDPVSRAARIMTKAEKAKADSENFKSNSENSKCDSENSKSNAENSKSSAVQPVSRHVNQNLLTTRKGSARVTPRKAIPAQINHQLNLRDSARCTQRDSQGIRCEAQRWLERHHVIPLAKGGHDTLENLTILCSLHHQLRHI